MRQKVIIKNIKIGENFFLEKDSNLSYVKAETSYHDDSYEMILYLCFAIFNNKVVAIRSSCPVYIEV